MAYNLVDDALAEVKVRANMPTTAGSVTDPEFLALGNSELKGIMTGRLLEAMQGYLLAEALIPFVGGQYLYDLPTRAVGQKLAYVAVQQSNSDRRMLASKTAAGMASASRAVGTYGLPDAFYWSGSQLGVYPAPSGAGESLVVGYYVRPSQMVLLAACAQISTAATAGTTALTTRTSASGVFTGLAQVDVVQAASGFRTTTTDAGISAFTTSTVTLTAPGLAQAASIGDFICAPGTSCVIQLPVEAQPLLVARWALRIMKVRAPSSPDTQSLAQDVSDLESTLFDYLSQRTEDQPQTLGPPGLLFPRSNGYGNGGGYY